MMTGTESSHGSQNIKSQMSTEGVPSIGWEHYVLGWISYGGCVK